MKVYIGPYITYYNVYKLAELLKYAGFSEKVQEQVGEYLSNTKLQSLFQWLNEIRNRKVRVHIHSYDVWSLDVTLAHIILPALIELQKIKHGHPNVDDIDVPEELHSINAEIKASENSWDSNADKRWEWVLNELIWTFTQMHEDSDWESLYHSGEIDIDFVPYSFDSEGEPESYIMEKGPNDTHIFDSAGYKKHDERIGKGLLLFGKYYRSLWD